MKPHLFLRTRNAVPLLASLLFCFGSGFYCCGSGLHGSVCGFLIGQPHFDPPRFTSLLHIVVSWYFIYFLAGGVYLFQLVNKLNCRTAYLLASNVLAASARGFTLWWHIWRSLPQAGCSEGALRIRSSPCKTFLCRRNAG